jgi:hypothetical protein
VAQYDKRVKLSLPSGPTGRAVDSPGTVEVDLQAGDRERGNVVVAEATAPRRLRREIDAAASSV